MTALGFTFNADLVAPHAVESFIRHYATDDNDDELQNALKADAENLAISLLGEPSKRLTNAQQMRWGAKGSLTLSRQGQKRGSWFNHEAGFGGGMLQLIVNARFCSYVDAKQWARDWIGLPSNRRSVYTGSHPAAALLASLADATGPDADEAKRIATARRLWGASVPVDGTLGELYLTEHRGIARPAQGWPDAAVRFHAGSKSLIVAATLPDGTVPAVQRVLLTDAGSKVSSEAAARLNPPTNKVTNGVQLGAAIRLPALLPDAPLLLAEGPETGLSVWAATGAETWIALGSLAKLELPQGRRVVACRDDDARYSPADRAATRAIRGWRKSGIDVVGVTPWRVRRFDKSDFNDVIRAEGIGAVRDAIALALNPQRATSFRPVEDMGTVRQGLLIGSLYLHAIAAELPPETWIVEPGHRRYDGQSIQPPAIGVRVDVGVGKSVFARAAAAEALALMRQRHDDRTIAVAVPTHQLGDEQAAAFNALPRARKAGLDAAVWRGRQAIDPQAFGEAMCLNLPAARDAMAAGLSVQTAACRRVIPGVSDDKCPFYDRCGYQRQRQTKADLWIVAHEMIYLEKPDTLGELAALVVDEAAWADGLEGIATNTTPPTTLSLGELDAACDVPGSPGASSRLRSLRNIMTDVLCTQPNGPFKRSVLLATGLTAASANEARGLEWRRKIDVGMFPGMAAKERREAAIACKGNLIIRKLEMMWTAVAALLDDDGPEASGWARVGEAASEHGTVRVAVLKGRKPIREGWRVPTLLIDANLNPDLVRPWWPFYTTAADLSVLTPHQRTRQVVDRAYSKRHFGVTGTKDAAEIRRGQRNMRELAATLDKQAHGANGQGTLIIANKVVEDALAGVWMKPPGVDTAHFNKIAGQDGWRGVGSLVTIGSTNPSPSAVEQLAEAITGQHVPPLPDWYERHAATRDTMDGPVLTEVECHPHPIAEAIRWQIREGEVVQAIGRARGVNRTAANPVDVLVMTDVLLPFPVEPVEAADLEPSPVEMMLAAGGVGLGSPTDAAKCYPQLWASAEAAKSAFHRARNGTNSDEEYLIGECPAPPTQAAYQLAGERRRPAIAWVDTSRVPDPETWLTARLGPLAKFEVMLIAPIDLPEAA